MMDTKASNSGKFNYRWRAQTLSSECFYAVVINLKCTDQVLVWDRGRPARNAYGRREQCELRLMYVGAGGTLAVPDKHLTRT